MLAGDPNIAGLRDCIVRRFGDFVGIGQPLVNAWVEQFGEFVAVETKQFTIETAVLQRSDFQRQ
ncbi:hypothetical protein CA85_01020 [Allorhodopirellula solitaria]|uniref:Uncharacterized protein n=1 Tax=Allorhodopirellula solitaria TaxID=2527987 RepID=A0A5C5YIW9_9BACT|nr:hypothetical protein CA85_01020 [Allorhodopirellula solitaria]